MREFLIKRLRRAIIRPSWDKFERTLSDRDAAFAERDAALMARNAALFERELALATRDALINRDGMALPLPPKEYLELVCGTGYSSPELEYFFHTVGWFLVDMLDSQRMLGESSRFLDIGCGCGRVARNLLNKKLASYIGFDRHAGMIDWCRGEITTKVPAFTFHHFNIKSVYEKLDQENGDISASEFKFPFENNVFDSVLQAFFAMVKSSNFDCEFFRETGSHQWYILTTA